MDSALEIRTAATELFAKKGLKFTMQDIADYMHIAKKTIYKIYPSKEALLLDMVDKGFAEIHRQKKRVMESDLPIQEKIAKALIALPAEYQKLDFRQLEGLGEKYPRVGQALNRNLENNWEPTMELIGQGVREGKIRAVSLPVLQIMVSAAIENFLSTDTLKEQGIAYEDALGYLTQIIMKGLEVSQS